MTAPLPPGAKARLEQERAWGQRPNGRPKTEQKRADYTWPRWPEGRLQDLLAWRPDLLALAETYGEPASPQPHTGHNGTSPIEAATAQARAVRHVYAAVASLAWHIAAVLDQAPIKGDPLTWLAMNAEHIRRHAPTDVARELDVRTKALHRTAATLMGYTPDRSDHNCPHCVVRGEVPTPKLERHATGKGLPLLYTCPLCGYAAILDPPGYWNNNNETNTLKHTWHARLAEVDAHLTTREVSIILGIPESTIRGWIHQQLIERDDDGHLSLAACAQLKRGNSEG